MTEKRGESVSAYMELVGRIAAVWAVLDLNFDSTIAQVAGGDALAMACVTAQFSSHYPKLKAIIALCKYKGAPKETIKDLESFLGRLNAVAERRNRAIHDAWLTKGGKIIGKVNLGNVHPPADETLEQLTSLRDASNKVLNEFSKLRIAIVNATGALR